MSADGKTENVRPNADIYQRWQDSFDTAGGSIGKGWRATAAIGLAVAQTLRVGHAVSFFFEPGNSTRYELVLLEMVIASRVDGGYMQIRRGELLVALPNYRGGRSFMLGLNDTVVHPTFLAEHDIGGGDCFHLAVLLSEVTTRRLLLAATGKAVQP